MRRLMLLALLAGCSEPAAHPPVPAAPPAATQEEARLRLTDLRGRELNLAGGVSVLIFSSTQCPVASAYINRILRLAEEFPKARIVLVHPNRSETAEELREHAEKAGIGLPIVKDEDQRLADRFRVTITPTAILLDASGAVRYRGRIDDSKMEDRVASHDLKRALGEVLAGQSVTTPQTEPYGCLVQRAKEVKSEEITYAKHVAPILNKHCASCHREGQIGPFPLTDYDEASAWADDLKRAVRRRSMPPWKPVNDPSLFLDPRVMTDEEIEIVSKWADAGAPAGDLREAPPLPEWKDGWMLGTPDLVLAPEGELEIPATGPDLYWSFALPTNLAEDKWVTAVEVRPGNPRVVHHVVTIVDGSAASQKYDREDPRPGYPSRGMAGGFIPVSEMGGWTPGMTPRFLPDGVGRFLPKNSTVVLDIHYHPSGRAERDRTSIGIYFAKKPIEKRLRWMPVFNAGFKIPAGAARHTVRAHWTVAQDSNLLGLIPHMHYRGREALVEAVLPDGRAVTLVDIKDWDFNWQELYFFSKPVRVPKGTKLRMTCTFDNSAENPNNPVRPPVAVGWGGGTTDEMVLSWVAFTMDKEQRAHGK